MAILIQNSGIKVVNTIAERNAIASGSRYQGMTVIVRDAIADPLVGGAYEATYRWNSTLSAWLLIHKNAKDNVNFTREEKTILTGGKVMADFVPQTGTVLNAYIVDETGLELAVATCSAVENEISIGTSDYDGKTLIYTYAYGAVQAAIADLSGVQSTVEW